MRFSSRFGNFDGRVFSIFVFAGASGASMAFLADQNDLRVRKGGAGVDDQSDSALWTRMVVWRVMN